MATRNVGGHNVTSVLNGSHHTVAHPSQPSFMPTQVQLTTMEVARAVEIFREHAQAVERLNRKRP